MSRKARGRGGPPPGTDFAFGAPASLSTRLIRDLNEASVPVETYRHDNPSRVWLSVPITTDVAQIDVIADAIADSILHDTQSGDHLEMIMSEDAVTGGWYQRLDARLKSPNRADHAPDDPQVMFDPLRPGPHFQGLSLSESFHVRFVLVRRGDGLGHMPAIEVACSPVGKWMEIGNDKDPRMRLWVYYLDADEVDDLADQLKAAAREMRGER